MKIANIFTLLKLEYVRKEAIDLHSNEESDCVVRNRFREIIFVTSGAWKDKGGWHSKQPSNRKTQSGSSLKI